MEPRIKDRFNDKILDEACRRYGIAPGHIHLLDGFESFMYEFDRPDGDFILRLGHSFRRTPELIHGGGGLVELPGSRRGGRGTGGILAGR